MISLWRRSRSREAARRSSTQASSRWSLRQAAIRSGSSSARTAQPGSLSWPQSAKRQCAASVSTSAKLSPVPSHRPATRMPGVSIRNAPPGSVSSSRVTVVWRPRGVVGAHVVGLLALGAEQRVDERRLAGAGGAEQDGGRAGREQGADGAEALAGHRADRDRVGDAEPAAELRGGRHSRRRRGRSSSARARPARRRTPRAPRSARGGAPSGRAAAR